MRTSLCKVLIVEDDDTTREMMKEMLLREGWEVTQAENGKIALGKVETEIPNLILLDLMMPEMDGFEFISNLRSNEKYVDIPVIVLTAKDITKEDHIKLSGHVEKIYQKSNYSKDTLLKQVRSLILRHTN